MATEDPKRPWEQQLKDAAAHLETDLKNVVKYLNDEVVPCTDWRSEWTTMRERRRHRLRLGQRMHRSRDARPSCLRCGNIGVRADGWRLSSGDYAGLSATATADHENGCES